MSNPGQAAAIAKRPPHGASTTHALRTVSTPITVTPSAVISAVPDGFDPLGCWVTFTPSVNCFIRFGYAASVGTATSSDTELIAGNEYNYWIGQPEDAYFSAVRSTADGVLKRARSS